MIACVPLARGRSAAPLHCHPPLLLLLLLLVFLLLLPALLLLLQLPRLQPGAALRFPGVASAVRCNKIVSSAAGVAADKNRRCYYNTTHQQTSQQPTFWQVKEEQQPLPQHQRCLQQQVVSSQGLHHCEELQHQQQPHQQQQNEDCRFGFGFPSLWHLSAAPLRGDTSNPQHVRTEGCGCNSSIYWSKRAQLPCNRINNNTGGGREARVSSSSSGTKYISSSQRKKTNGSSSNAQNSSSRRSVLILDSVISSEDFLNSRSNVSWFPHQLCLSYFLLRKAAIACDTPASAVAAVPHARTPHERHQGSICDVLVVASSPSLRRSTLRAAFLFVATPPAGVRLSRSAAAMVCLSSSSSKRVHDVRCARPSSTGRTTGNPSFFHAFEPCHSNCRRICGGLSSTDSNESNRTRASRSRCSSYWNSTHVSSVRRINTFGGSDVLYSRGKVVSCGGSGSTERSRTASLCKRETRTAAVNSIDCAAAKVAAVEKAFLDVVRSARVWLASKNKSCSTCQPAEIANPNGAATYFAGAADIPAAAAAPGAVDVRGTPVPGIARAASTVGDTAEYAAAAVSPSAAGAATSGSAADSRHAAWKQLQDAVNTFHSVARGALGIRTQQQLQEREILQWGDVDRNSSRKQQQHAERQQQQMDLQGQDSEQTCGDDQRKEQHQSYQQLLCQQQQARQRQPLHRAVDPGTKNKKRGRNVADSSSAEDGTCSSSTPVVWYDEGKKKLMVDRLQLLREKGETSRGDWTLRFLGTGSMQSSLSRNTSAILFTKGDGVSWLFDCGGGASAATLPPPSSSPFRSRASQFLQQVEAVAAGRERETDREAAANECLHDVTRNPSTFVSPAGTAASAHTVASSSLPGAALVALGPSSTAAAPPSFLRSAAAAAMAAIHGRAEASAAGERSSTGIQSAFIAADRGSCSDNAAVSSDPPSLTSTTVNNQESVGSETSPDIAAAAAIAVAAAAVRGAGLVGANEAVDVPSQPRKKRVSRIAAVFITHLHGDHVLGLPSLLSQIAAAPTLQLQETDCSNNQGKKQLDKASNATAAASAFHQEGHSRHRPVGAHSSGPSSNQPHEQAQQLPIVDVYGPQGLRNLLRAIFLGTYVRRCAPYRVHEFREVPCLHHHHPSGRRCVHAVLPELPRTPFEVEGGKNIFARADGTYEAHTEAGAKVLAIPIRHIIPTVGYVVEETGRARRRLNAAAVSPLVEKNAAALALLPALHGQPKAVFKILSELMPGESYTFPDGTILQHEDAFEEETQRLRKFCVCLDTCDASPMAKYIRNCDLMIHESTLCETGRPRAEDAAELGCSDACRKNASDCELGPEYPRNVNSSGDSTNRSSSNSDGREERFCSEATCRIEGKQWSAANEEAFARGHSTAALAGELAGRVGARRVVLTHFSQRYKGDASLASVVMMQKVEHEALESLLRAQRDGFSAPKRLEVAPDGTPATGREEMVEPSPLRVLAAFDGMILHISHGKGV